MGSATQPHVIAALAALAIATIAGSARADDCTGISSSGGRFATCFDTGNRLSLTAGSDGFGGSIGVRHVVNFADEPDLVWKLEHVIADATHAAFEDRFSAVVYRGRFLRHARDGHIVLPLGVPKKIFLPFDVGALAEVGRIRWRPDADPMQPSPVTIGVVKTAALVDLSRTRGFRRRFAFGPVARWDLEVTRSRAVTGHAVAPFSTALANVFVESADGRLSGDFRLEAGTVWHSDTAWQPELVAEAAVERIMLAINDRPIALMLGARYESATDEAIARIGARVVLFDRRDPRVQLDALRKNVRKRVPRSRPSTKELPATTTPPLGPSTKPPPEPAPPNPASSKDPVEPSHEPPDEPSIEPPDEPSIEPPTEPPIDPAPDPIELPGLLPSVEKSLFVPWWTHHPGCPVRYCYLPPDLPLKLPSRFDR